LRERSLPTTNSKRYPDPKGTGEKRKNPNSKLSPTELAWSKVASVIQKHEEEHNTPPPEHGLRLGEEKKTAGNREKDS